MCCIDTSRNACYGYDQIVEIFGNKGLLEAQNEVVKFSDSEGIHGGAVEYSFPTRYKESYRCELEEFAACYLDDKDVPITHDDGLKNFKITEIVTNSVAWGRVINLYEYDKF